MKVHYRCGWPGNHCRAEPGGGDSVCEGKRGWRARVEFWRGEQEGFLNEGSGGGGSRGVVPSPFGTIYLVDINSTC